MSTGITEGPTKQTQVSTEIQRQANQSGELQEVVDKLEARLANVVTECPDEAIQEPEPDTRTLVLLAGEIAASNGGTQKCILRLRSLLSRIEL